MCICIWAWGAAKIGEGRCRLDRFDLDMINIYY